MFPKRFSNLPAYAFPRLRSLLDAYQLGGEGMPALLEAAREWAARRYGVTLDLATRVMALNGTREGLYNAMMANPSFCGAQPVLSGLYGGGIERGGGSNRLSVGFCTLRHQTPKTLDRVGKIMQHFQVAGRVGRAEADSLYRAN